jgi:DNA sulfur modification protein DndC
LLRETAGEDYALVRDLLAVEHRYRQMERRAGLYPALEKVLRRHYFRSEEEALAADQEEHEAQLRLMTEMEPNKAGESPEEKRARVVRMLDGLAEHGGTVGALAASVMGDLAVDT